MILDVLLDAVLDTLKLLPFLFLTYLAMEYIEHKMSDKAVALVNKAGHAGPVIGGALGVIPQCGFSAAMSNLYAGGLITRGTILAVFLSTSDEMLPILISERVPIGLIFKILLIKFLAGIIVGIAVDLLSKNKNERHIHDLCEEDDCGCEHGIVHSAIHHTLQIIVFILVINIVLNFVIELVGTERLSAFILNKPVIGELLSGIIGLIPNCAASVAITELYLQGGMSLGAMLSGLLVGSGLGLLVLFRMNKNTRDNLITLAILYASGVIIGCIVNLF